METQKIVITLKYFYFNNTIVLCMHSYSLLSPTNKSAAIWWYLLTTYFLSILSLTVPIYTFYHKDHLLHVSHLIALKAINTIILQVSRLTRLKMHRKYFQEQTELGASLRVGMNGQSFPPHPRCKRCWDWDCCSRTTPCRALGPPLCSRWTQAPLGEIPGVRPECLRILLADQHKVWYSGQGPRNLVENKTLSNTGKPCGSLFFFIQG